MRAPAPPPRRPPRAPLAPAARAAALLVTAAALQARAPAEASAQELTVSAAVSLKDALEEIVPAFERAHRDVTVRLNLGASGELQRQIEAGVPVDVFVSASSRNMDALQERGAVDPRTRRDLACNRLVVVAAADARAPASLADLAGTENLALGNPKTVPAGQYARQALEAAGLWERLQPSYVFAENVRAALEYVARGDAAAAFVYATDAPLAGDAVRVAFDVDPALHDPIVYPAAVVAGSRNRVAARRFVEFLTSPAARAALRKRGFSLPACLGAEARG